MVFFYWKSIGFFEFKIVLYLNSRSLSHFIEKYQSGLGLTKWVGYGRTGLRQAGFGYLAFFFFFFLLSFTNQMGLDLAFGPC